MTRSEYRALQRAIGYRFRRVAHLKMALTHPSFRYEDDSIEGDNQRLEFLGDAVLGLATAAYLYETHRDLQEGDLTKLRSQVTSRQGLAEIGLNIGLGQYLQLGKGERQSGGEERPSNLADALEAILGAAYLDGRLKAVQKIFNHLFVPALQNLSSGDPWANNPKGALQEFCQEHWKVSPRYNLTAEEGPPHHRRFTVEVELNGKALSEGTDLSKRGAEMEAARAALDILVRERGEEP
jgi:ribonuclease-3